MRARCGRRARRMRARRRRVTLSEERMAALLCNKAGGVEFGELIKAMRLDEELNITKRIWRADQAMRLDEELIMR